jgi:hypothetical protein
VVQLLDLVYLLENVVPKVWRQFLKDADEAL